MGFNGENKEPPLVTSKESGDIEIWRRGAQDSQSVICACYMI